MIIQKEIQGREIFEHKSHLQPQPLLAFVVLLLVFLISGCAATTHEVKTPLSVPDSFSESGYASLSDQWWLSFEDPVLNGLIDHALMNNFNLKTAWARLNQAEAVAEKAGAGLFPALDAEMKHQRNRAREDGETRNTHSSSLGFAARYEVDLWGRIRSSRDAVAFAAQASAEDLMATALTLSAQVTSIWYQLVEQYGQLDVLGEQIETNKKVLEIVTLQVRTGQTGISDMLQQQQLIEFNQGEQDLTLARVSVLEHQLAILLGYPPGKNLAPRVAAFTDLPSLPQLGVPVELIQNRPDIRSSFFRVKAANSELAAAIADRFPQLSLTAGVYTTGVNTSDLFSNWLATLAANLIGPLIDGGLRRAEVDRSRAVATEALNAYGQTILEALGEVENALVQEERQRNFIVSIERQLTLAEHVVERLQERFFQGSVDYLRVLDALLSLQKLQRNQMTARKNLVQYRIDLCLALGSGWNLQPPTEENSPAEPERYSKAIQKK